MSKNFQEKLAFVQTGPLKTSLSEDDLKEIREEVLIWRARYASVKAVMQNITYEDLSIRVR